MAYRQKQQMIGRHSIRGTIKKETIPNKCLVSDIKQLDSMELNFQWNTKG